MSVAYSILLYDAEIWADALNVSKYRRRIASVQRRCALRVVCAYRTGMGLLNSPHCDYCECSVGSAEHTFFECVRWNDNRRTLKVIFGGTCTPESIVAWMVESKTNWSATASYVEKVLRKKKI